MALDFYVLKIIDTLAQTWGYIVLSEMTVCAANISLISMTYLPFAVDQDYTHGSELLGDKENHSCHFCSSGAAQTKH